MERETQQVADALRRSLDQATGVARLLREPLAKIIERGFVSLDELQRLIAEKVPDAQRASATQWILNLLETHDVVITSVELLNVNGQVKDASTPEPETRAPRAPRRRRITGRSPQIPDDEVLFQWKASAGGDNRFYRRRGEGRWYADDMMEVCMAKVSELESAYRSK